MVTVSPSDAWVVALLGMASVFAGLGVMILLARLYGRLDQRKKVADAARASAPAVEPPGPAPAPRPALPPTEPVPDEVLAVLTAVIDVESKLYLGRPDARLTIRRAAARS
jgi:hypothetical protein